MTHNSLEQAATGAAVSDREPTTQRSSVEASLQITPASDAEILQHLRRSAQIAAIAEIAEQDQLVLRTCEQRGIELSEEELQTAGDAFRLEHKLLGSTETFTWLAQQRITVEEWSEGIRMACLAQKLKEHLFGLSVDGAYINNRDAYRRVALSQILVLELPTALQLVQTLRSGEQSFCALALEYSKGKQSHENGGFAGIRFVVELLPEIAEAIAEVPAGEIVGPIQTRLGYHILRVEKWFPSELHESVRNLILDSLFQAWVQELRDP